MPAGGEGVLVIKVSLQDVTCKVSHRGGLLTTGVGVLLKATCKLPQLYIYIYISIDIRVAYTTS